ncbi:MAG: MBL fold metallo-hydrolase [Thermoguttaceae bacterium]|jgi:metallo-beta-lactamase family protein|nr:MBL fold metallo-hydrolase [Thermoguttaceae bacterium]
MQIAIHGAGGGEVTGSAYHIRTREARILVDCGLLQGARKADNYNRLPRKGAFDKLDAVLLTHAHLDHTGRLPLLSRAGYHGPIYATPATIELADLILQDSAHLQKSDVKRQNRRRQRQGQALIEPLYEQQDVESLRPLYQPLCYNQPTTVAPGVVARGVEAGHMLGSVSIELTVEEDGRRKVVIFSGDLGPRGAPLHRDPIPFKHADFVFMESTYGDRDHRSLQETAIETREVVKKAVEAGGKVLVPVFAVGRTQLLLYLLAGAFERRTLSPFPVYIDSPMAIEATKIYAKHTELFDAEALAMQQSGDLREHLETVQFCPTAEDSRALNDLKGPCLIMAGAGMCTGGRILHHFRHNLCRQGTTVLIVGYQSQGSLGRMLVDRKNAVTIFGEKIPVRASVHTFGGLSAHAGQSDLLRWLDSMAASHPRVFVTHGEERARKPLGKLIQERCKLRVDYPAMGETVEI